MKAPYTRAERIAAGIWTLILIPVMVFAGPFYLAPEMFRSILSARRQDAIVKRWQRARSSGQVP